MLFRSDRKSTRLNSSHTIISYAVFCLKKKAHAQRRLPPASTHTLVAPAPTPQSLPSASDTPRARARHITAERLGCAVSLFFFFGKGAPRTPPLSPHSPPPG